MGDNATAIESVQTRALETVNTQVELEAENENIEAEITQTENDIAALRAQIQPPVAAAATELDEGIGREERTAPVAAAAETLDDGGDIADDTAPVAAAPEVTEENGMDVLTTAGGGKIKTDVGNGGDNVIIQDPNGQEIRVHGDPHLDFGNDGSDEAHFGDNSQIHLSDGSIVHLNSVQEENGEWYTRGIFLEDTDGTVTQIGRSADDSEHVAEAQHVDKSAIQDLGSDEQGAAIFGMNADGTAMIKNGDTWNALGHESFDEFKQDMSFQDQIGEEIDPGFASPAGAEESGGGDASSVTSVDVAGANAAGVDAQIGNGSLAIDAQNSALQAQIDSLEGDVQVLNAYKSLNDADILDAAAEANEARAELTINATLPEGVETNGVTASTIGSDVSDDNILILGAEEPESEFDIGVIDSDVDADVITADRRDVNGLGQG